VTKQEWVLPSSGIQRLSCIASLIGDLDLHEQIAKREPPNWPPFSSVSRFRSFAGRQRNIDQAKPLGRMGKTRGMWTRHPLASNQVKLCEAATYAGGGSAKRGSKGMQGSVQVTNKEHTATIFTVAEEAIFAMEYRKVERHWLSEEV
jgi:hypothetical protein